MVALGNGRVSLVRLGDGRLFEMAGLRIHLVPMVILSSLGLSAICASLVVLF